MTEADKNIDFEIIWKKIHNQTTEEEEILLSKWLADDVSHRSYYSSAVNYYENGSQFANSASELEKALRKIHQKTGIYSPNRKAIIIAISSVAASILLLIYLQVFNFEKPIITTLEQQAQSIVPGSNRAVLILADGSEHDLTSGGSSIISADGTEIKNSGTKLEYQGKNGQPAEMKYNTLKIPRGGEYFLVLSDSTKVWLNSETTLRFPVQFAGDIRNVELTGEAYFEVSRNEKVPFIVTSGNQQIRVLGTQFNISSYPDDQNIYTTLVSGKVEVSLTSDPEAKMTLSPSEQSVIDKNNFQIRKSTVDVSPYVAWKDGRFVFQDEMLEDIMKTLSKWYDVQVVFANNADKELRFTGNLERYADFSNILKKIERTNEVEFQITNNTITIQ